MENNFKIYIRQKVPRSQPWKDSSFITIWVKSLIAMEIVQIDHVTCEVTLDYFSVKIGFWLNLGKMLNLSIFGLEGHLNSSI